MFLDRFGNPLPTWREAQRALIDQALTHFRGNKVRAATALGISIRTMRNKVIEFDLTQWRRVEWIRQDDGGRAKDGPIIPYEAEGSE